VWMWGFSSSEIVSLGSVLYGTKWLFQRTHVQDPAFHSNCRIAEGMNRRGSTIDHCGSQCKGWGPAPYTYIHSVTDKNNNQYSRSLCAISCYCTIMGFSECHCILNMHQRCTTCWLLWLSYCSISVYFACN
jgi:hypothetical protein